MEDEDPLREARAMNTSILFMLSMPYVLLAVLGILFYRSIRAAKKQSLREAAANHLSSVQAVSQISP